MMSANQLYLAVSPFQHVSCCNLQANQFLPENIRVIIELLVKSVGIRALKEHRVRQLEARIKMGDRWKEQGLIFGNIYGAHFNPNHVWRLFKKLLKVAGLPNVRFHDLRHSAATVLIAAGVPLKVVSELLGHSSVATTADIYAHVLPEMQQEVVKKMDDLYGGS